VTRSWWGWGDVQAALGPDELDGVRALVGERFGLDRPPADPVEPEVPAPRVHPPDALVELASVAPLDRVRHARGNAYRDVVRAIRGELTRFPDVVLRPRDAQDVERVLDWCSGANVACLPYGGGSSVVGGVNPPEGPSVSLDLERLSGVTDVDPVSLAARIRGGTLGPDLEDQLRPYGLTLRFFPQSWEFSTLGGWIATRAGGHFATGPTHVDDLVESVEAVTPAGRWASRRLPASGAGPSPDRLWLGSEGALGVVTAAWMRVRRRPVHRSQATVALPSFDAGLDAVRALVQSGLRPANARLLDETEAALNGAGDGRSAVLVLAFESADHAQRAALDRALELCRDHGGHVTGEPRHREGDVTASAEDGSGAWRRAFVRAPYLRDGLVRLGAVVETFETAVTWDRAAALVTEVRETAARVATDVLGAAVVTVRTTHAYPDGVAPYLTVIGPGRPGDEVRQWDEVKAAVSEAILAAGGTITHHHAVGRDHARWYARQRPALHAEVLRATRQVLDPAGVMNPGVLGTWADGAGAGRHDP
jgi:alkyldihydroxyacetonephosphate synthase